jgi:hypothetical protein
MDGKMICAELVRLHLRPISLMREWLTFVGALRCGEDIDDLMKLCGSRHHFEESKKVKVPEIASWYAVNSGK